MNDDTRDSWPSNPVTLALRGFAVPFRALSFIRRHRLSRLVGVAIGVNVVLLALLIAAAFWLLWPWYTQLSAALLGLGEGNVWLTSFLTILAWIMLGALGIITVALCGIVLLLVGQAAASPFLDVLSERVEAVVLQRFPAETTVQNTLRSVRISLGDLVFGLIFLVVAHIPIGLVGLVPGPGTAASAVASVTFSALLLAHEFVGLPLTRQGVSYRGRWRMVRKNWAYALGFGGAVMLALVVPGLNLVLLPVATVGGTLAYCDLKRAGRI